MKILKTFSEVALYLSAVRSFADQDKASLGFFTKATFEEKACGGKLWVAIDEETRECIGYLLFGGVFPSIRIFQLFVSPFHRQQGIGKRLVGQLVEFGEAESYLNISARVGADLDANKFWERIGFNLARQEPGGKSTGRTINVRVRDLDTPSLLKGMGLATKAPAKTIQDLRFSHPISRSPIYVLDLNVFFDVVRCRVHREQAASLMQAGFNHHIGLRVTPEFTEELRRHTQAGSRDPVLELAQTLPTLPKIELNELKLLRQELRSIVFPHHPKTNNVAERVHSDLTHLIYCVHHRATGFVTRDKAILRAGDKLREKFGLEVIAPADLAKTYFRIHAPVTSLQAFCGEQKVSFAVAEDREREEVELFLQAAGADSEARAVIWDPGSSGSLRKRVTIRIQDQLIGVASWDAASRFKPDVRLYFYLNEENPATDTVIDHLFEKVFGDVEMFSPKRIFLYTTSEQTRTIATALERGFVKAILHGAGDNPPRLAKFCFRGVVTKSDWPKFAAGFQRATGLRLPNKLPAVAEFLNTGMPIEIAKGQSSALIKLFDFETLASPAVVLCPGRTGLIVPIRPRFAENLFPNLTYQLNLIPSKEAILHVEKAYFRYPRNVGLFDSGVPILFYLSGKGGKEVIGCGRITYSDVMPVEKVGVSVWRQGVLSDIELREIADKSGEVHVFTFDNVNLFPNRVPYSFLRANKLISGANLVTVERLQPEQISRICRCGFGLEKIE